MPSNNASISSYSVWIFVSNWQYKYGEEKIIFTKGPVTDPDIKLYLHPTQNNIVITTYQSNILPDFIYLNVKFIQNKIMFIYLHYTTSGYLVE